MVDRPLTIQRRNMADQDSERKMDDTAAVSVAEVALAEVVSGGAQAGQEDHHGHPPPPIGQE